MSIAQQMVEQGYGENQAVMHLAKAEDLIQMERGDLADELAFVRHELMDLADSKK